MLLFLVTLILCYLFSKEAWNRWQYDIHRIPSPPKLPFLGHTLAVKKGNKSRAINVWVQEWRAKLGFPKLMRLTVPGEDMVIVADMDLARLISSPKASVYPKGGAFFSQFQRLVMGDDSTVPMFSVPTTTPYVKAIRRCYTSSFTHAGLKQAFGKQLNVMRQGMLFLEARHQRDTVDVQDFFNRLMLDSFGEVQFDMDFGGLDNSSPLYQLIIDCGFHVGLLTAVPFLELVTKLFPRTRMAKRINQDFADLQEQWTKIATEVYNRSEPEEEDITIAANLKRVCLPGTNDRLPFNLLKGELATVIIAGFETTSHQLSWIFALLATHPEVVDKLLDELRNHGLFGEGARELEFEDLSELTYLTAVIKEGMRRLHTFVFVAGKTTSNDLVLDGFRIPKGMNLAVCSNLSMNCEQEWEDHLAFKPERWLHDQTTKIKDKYYIPFGMGERECAGMKLAMQSMRVAIVYYIMKYSFELVGETVDSLIANGITKIIFEADNAINMKVTSRKQT